MGDLDLIQGFVMPGCADDVSAMLSAEGNFPFRICHSGVAICKNKKTYLNENNHDYPFCTVDAESAN